MSARRNPILPGADAISSKMAIASAGRLYSARPPRIGRASNASSCSPRPSKIRRARSQDRSGLDSSPSDISIARGPRGRAPPRSRSPTVEPVERYARRRGPGAVTEHRQREGTPHEHLRQGFPRSRGRSQVERCRPPSRPTHHQRQAVGGRTSAPAPPRPGLHAAKRYAVVHCLGGPPGVTKHDAARLARDRKLPGPLESQMTARRGPRPALDPRAPARAGRRRSLTPLRARCPARR